jgi:hypothetical protein
MLDAPSLVGVTTKAGEAEPRMRAYRRRIGARPLQTGLAKALMHGLVDQAVHAVCHLAIHLLSLVGVKENRLVNPVR